MILDKEVITECPILVVRQGTRMLGRVGGAQEFKERIRIGEGGQGAGRGDDGRNSARNREALISGMTGVAAAAPAILVLDVQAAELHSQPLTLISVTGHAVQPIQVTTPFILGWFFRQGRLSQPVGWLRGWG